MRSLKWSNIKALISVPISVLIGVYRKISVKVNSIAISSHNKGSKFAKSVCFDRKFIESQNLIHYN